MPAAPSLRRSLVALYAIQLSNYVVPLITLPWLTRTLGPLGFGRVGFCMAVAGYFTLLTDYGFNLSATRAIAVHGADIAARSRIFWNTLSVKIMLATAGVPILIALYLFVPRFHAEGTLPFVSYLAVAGSVLTPNWFFQGMERQATLSATTLAVRFSAVPVTYLLVRRPTDVSIAAAITGMSPIIVAIICMLRLRYEGAVLSFCATRAGMLAALSEGWHLFLSNASMSLYTASNTILLGIVSGPTAVGYYSAADRLTQAAQGLLAPINQSVYPRISRLMHESQKDGYVLIRRVLRILGSVALSLSLCLLILAPLLVPLLYGRAYGPTVQVLRWLAPLPFVVGLSNVFGIHTMLSLGMNRPFSRIVSLAGLVNVVLLLVMASMFGASGAAAAVLVTEIFVTAAMAHHLWQNAIPIFGRKVLAQ